MAFIGLLLDYFFLYLEEESKRLKVSSRHDGGYNQIGFVYAPNASNNNSKLQESNDNEEKSEPNSNDNSTDVCDEEIYREPTNLSVPEGIVLVSNNVYGTFCILILPFPSSIAIYDEIASIDRANCYLYF